ncbi:MAG: class I SAM-dependent methyltransferase [Candidatus Paceibacterota bacterium]|jgi:ubiquinone/menaquinone biosynthesis C-methylase UbiE
MKKNIDYWEEALKDSPQSYKKWFKEEKKYLCKIITLGSRVLDVGCGNGRSIFDVLPMTQNVVGLDHDEKAVLDARKIFSKYPSVKIIKAEATAMPFDEGVFDLVICMGTFGNFADGKIPILREMSRVLSGTGKIVVSVYSEDAFDERMKLYRSLGTKIKEIRGTTVIFDESLGDNISEQFSEKELRDIFSKVDLRVDNVTKVGIGYICLLGKR